MGWFSRGRDRGGQGQDPTVKKAFKRGQREFAAGRFDAAAAAFREVVALAPESADSQFLLGAALFNIGDSKAAIEPLRRCLALRPEHATAHFTLGMSLGRLDEDQLEAAVEHVAKAAALGDRQAREMLPRLGADFCRKCARPAYVGRGDVDADVIIMGPRIGMRCTGCRTVLCSPCATRGQSGPMIPACPDCGDPLRALT